MAETPWIDMSRDSLQPDGGVHQEQLGDTVRTPLTHQGKTASDAGATLVGTTIGDYELLEVIGRGGMGVVYRARQRSTKRPVALKLLKSWDPVEASPRSQQLADRFQTEIVATAQLTNDHVVTVYESGQWEGVPYYSMQFIDGPSLHQKLADGPMEPRKAAAYFQPLAAALAQAHQAGILHRDLKPANILCDVASDRFLIADFGLAKLVGDER